jgi:hypothetical protein
VQERLAVVCIARLDRADHTEAPARGEGDGLEHVARGRLPVRAGDTENTHRARRVTEQSRRDRPDGRAHRGDTRLWALDVDETLHQERRRARAFRRDRVAMTVHRLARDATEQGALVDLTAVVPYGTNLDISVAPELDHVEIFEEVVQAHGSS